MANLVVWLQLRLNWFIETGCRYSRYKKIKASICQFHISVKEIYQQSDVIYFNNEKTNGKYEASASKVRANEEYRSLRAESKNV